MPAKGFESIKGKTILVTGASGGIGEVIVASLISYGATVIGVDIAKSESKLKELHAQYRGAFRYYTADLMDAQVCTDFPRKTGPIDSLVNCAGLAKISPLFSQTAKDWDLTLNLNAKTVFLLSQAYAKAWVASGNSKGRSIVNLSSQASLAPLPGHLTYSVSKAASDMITRVMAMELGPHGIRVNAVNPTVVLTAMGRANWSDPKVAGPMLSSIPLNRFAEPEEVSEVVAFLISDASGMINGHMIPVDGGFVATRQNLMPKNQAKL